MAKKKYRANSCVSISVLLESGTYRRVVFNAMSNGTSEFATSDEELQKSIEKHQSFNKLFRIVDCKQTCKKTKNDKGKNDSANEQEEKNDLREVHVTDMAAAKDYLAENYGVVRTSMRSVKAIKEEANKHGITFDGI